MELEKAGAKYNSQILQFLINSIWTLISRLLTLGPRH